MKFQEIAGLSAAELRQRIQKARRELFDARMLLSMKRLSNPLSIRLLRKDIARLQTALWRKKESFQEAAKLRGKA